MAGQACGCCGAEKLDGWMVEQVKRMKLQKATGMCEHGFLCGCMESPICVKCDRCEKHCKCAEPELHASYVEAAQAMRAELQAERTLRVAHERLREIAA
jgi:hypothetical protein